MLCTGYTHTHILVSPLLLSSSIAIAVVCISYYPNSLHVLLLNPIRPQLAHALNCYSRIEIRSNQTMLKYL
ncbi:hypothetical protein BDZ91DRAFT_375130 [Kalaharituber pfeilii]|nr:hypothetical protein BDZ91DRAFT_375130 [Kalaharituber pfeilii]